MKAMNWVWGMIVGCLMAMPSAQAQWAVVDVAAIKQLVVQVELLEATGRGDAEPTRSVEADALGPDGWPRDGVAAADERCAAELPSRGLGGNAQGAGRYERLVRRA